MSIAEMEAVSEVEERILSLWSTPGASWFRVEAMARELGIYPGTLAPRLQEMLDGGLLRRIVLTTYDGGGERWNISAAGLALNEYFRGLYAQPVKALSL